MLTNFLKYSLRHRKWRGTRLYSQVVCVKPERARYAGVRAFDTKQQVTTSNGCEACLAAGCLASYLRPVQSNRGLEKWSGSIFVTSGLDVKDYPTRTSGLPRKFVRDVRVSPSLKCLVGLKPANVSICATFMVLLAGDIQQNPRPVKDPCLVFSSGCRKAQKAIQCDICHQWFHAKCIGIKAPEYNQLCDLTKAWQCLKCLFPGFATPVCCSRKGFKAWDERQDNAVPGSTILMLS